MKSDRVKILKSQKYPLVNFNHKKITPSRIPYNKKTGSVIQLYLRDCLTR